MVYYAINNLYFKKYHASAKKLLFNTENIGYYIVFGRVSLF